MTTEDQQTARRKRNIKCWALILAGVIAQTVIIILFVLLVLRARNPKVRIVSATVGNLKINTSSSSSPHFSMDLNAEIAVKNTNFGHFKFENSTVTVLYRGTNVGQGTLAKGRARARSTKKFHVTLPVNSLGVVNNTSILDSDLKLGTLNFTGEAKVDGKIILFKLLKKKKSVQMNCTMEVQTATLQVQNFMCK